MAARTADLEVRARNRKLRRDLKQLEKMVAAFGKRAGGKLKAGFTAATGGLLAIGTFAGFATIGKEAFDFETILTRIGIQAGGGVNLDQLRMDAKAVAAELGLDQIRMAEALTEIVNLEGAAGATSDKMTLLARAAVATGAGMAELAGTSFALNNAFRFENAADAERGMSAVIAAGKAGSVPLTEMNAVLQQTAARFSEFSAKGSEGAAQLAAFIQIGRRGFGTAAEAGVGLLRVMDQLEQKEAGIFKEFGVSIRVGGKVGEGALRELVDVFEELDQKAVTSSSKFIKVFTSAPARKFLKAGIRGLRTQTVGGKEKIGLLELIDVSKKANAVQEDSETFLASSAGRMVKSIARVKAAFIDLITPERIAKFVSAAEKAAFVVELLADNIGLLVGALILFKSVQAGVAIFTMASNMKALALASKDAAGGIGGVSSQASGFTGKLGKLAQGAGLVAAAGAVGFGIGTLIEEQTGVGRKTGAFLGGLEGKRIDLILAENARQNEAAETTALRSLRASGQITGRVIAPELVSGLRAKEQAGGELTEQERAAQTLLKTGLGQTGAAQRLRGLQFEKASGQLATRAIRQAQETGGELTSADIRRVLNEGTLLSNLQGASFLGSRTEENVAALVLVIEKLNQTLEKDKRITVAVDGAAVFTAVQNTPAGRRAPAR